MKGRGLEIALLVAVVAVLVAIALASAGRPPSTYSTFDTGPSGYRVLFDVLERERIPVARLEAPLAQLPAGTGVLVATPPLPALGTALPIAYGVADRKRIETFMRHGGTVLAFGTIGGLRKSPRLRTLAVADDTNAALAKHPRNALAVYDAVAGRGTVVFDERLHGYDRTRSLWSVLPAPVRASCWLAALAIVLLLVDANVRFAPPILQEPPADRDSSDYLLSMARLLRRARAGSAAIARFAQRYPDNTELAALAARRHPTDAQVVRAATIYGNVRKDHA